MNSNAGDTVRLNLMDVAATDPNGGLLVVDIGHGVDTVNMLNVSIAGRVVVILSDSVPVRILPVSSSIVPLPQFVSETPAF